MLFIWFFWKSDGYSAIVYCICLHLSQQLFFHLVSHFFLLWFTLSSLLHATSLLVFTTATRMWDEMPFCLSRKSAEKFLFSVSLLFNTKSMSPPQIDPKSLKIVFLLAMSSNQKDFEIIRAKEEIKEGNVRHRHSINSQRSYSNRNCGGETTYSPKRIKITKQQQVTLNVCHKK